MNFDLATSVLDVERVSDFARECFQAPQNAELALVPLRGGLEVSGIAKAKLSWPGESGQRSICFVVKRVSDLGHRELDVYQALRKTEAASVMPRLLGSDRIGADLSYMYIEWVRSAQPWPWRNTGYSEALITRLAGVHSLRTESLKAAIPKWDYEADLLRSAQRTLEVYSDAALSGTAPGSRSMLRTLERVAATLPAMRVALQSAHPQAFLHGDVHAGNAVLHRDGDQPELILLDWGRARFGSPLEDIASWLQSLGYWEYEVRRRHDTLFRHYLEARNLSDRFTPELRNLYWFAASSNALAGALRYHLAVMGDPERTRHEQSASAGSVIDWLRIIRRADACWRN